MFLRNEKKINKFQNDISINDSIITNNNNKQKKINFIPPDLDDNYSEFTMISKNPNPDEIKKIIKQGTKLDLSRNPSIQLTKTDNDWLMINQEKNNQSATKSVAPMNVTNINSTPIVKLI